MRRAIAIVAVLAIALAADGAGTARADAAAEARFWDGLARQAYARGRYADALELFLASNRAVPAPRTLYNVALCAAMTHDDALAYASFTEYLEADDGHPERRADAERRRAELARRLALVRIESDPPGATIWIDRRELGAYGTTPRTVVLSPGAHVVELERADRHPGSVEVEAAVGEQRDARATLAPRTGTVRVDVGPAGASTEIALERDGERIAIAAGRDEVVPIGAWTARIASPGMREATIALVVGEDRPTVRRVDLEALPAPSGLLLVRTEGVRARVAIDGEPRAETPARLELRAGEHEIEIEAAGRVGWARRVHVREGETVRLDVTLVEE